MTKDRVAFAMSSHREINRRGFARPALTCLQVAIIIIKWLPNMVKLSGALDSAHNREDTNILLAQITLRSDYSGFVKEL